MGGYGTVTYDYNQIGNLLSHSDVGTYTYPASGASSRRPRGDGGRVKKTVQGTTTVYIGQLYVCTGTACAKLIYAGAQRVAMVQVGSGSTSYFHADHLGSTSVLTNASGTAEEHNSYEPYGDLHTHTGTSDEVYKYTGQERDASTDLYFYQARYYAQGLGRFVSPDSIVQNPLDPQAFNRYAYARNNPVRYTDPTGHWWNDWPGDNWPGDNWGGGGPGAGYIDPSTGVYTIPYLVVGTRLPPESLFSTPFGTDLLGMDPWGLASWVPPPSFTFLTSGGGGMATNQGRDIPITRDCGGVNAYDCSGIHLGLRVIGNRTTVTIHRTQPIGPARPVFLYWSRAHPGTSFEFDPTGMTPLLDNSDNSVSIGTKGGTRVNNPFTLNINYASGYVSMYGPKWNSNPRQPNQFNIEVPILIYGCLGQCSQ